jgi:hypothetical protein
MARYFIPIMRYVGGEDYEVVDREVRPVDASADEIRNYLRHGSDDGDSMFLRHTFKGGRFLRERRLMEHAARREERHMMLHLRRKETA